MRGRNKYPLITAFSKKALHDNAAHHAQYWLFWLIIAVMAALFPPFAWHDNTSGFLTDDAMYLLMADFFSRYHEGNALVDAFIIDRSRFPPAFPILIGLFGGGSTNIPVAHLVTCATFLLSGVMFYFWAARMLASRELGAACLAIYALLPKTLVYAIEIWSEFLYMAFVFAAFLLMDAARRAGNNAHQALFACALFIGLSLLTRTIGIALLAAFVLFLFWHGMRRKLLYLLVVAALPLSWQLVKVINGYQGEYSGDLERYFSTDGVLQLILEDMPRNAVLLAEAWGRHFAAGPGAPWPALLAALLLMLPVLIGGARRAVGGHPDPWYILAYIPIVLVWPHPDHITRFLYPLMPLALVYAFTGLSAALPRTHRRARRLSRVGLMLLCLLMVYPNALFVTHRFLTPLPAYIGDDFRHTRQWLRGNNLQRNYNEAERKEVVISLIKRIDQHLAPHECLYAVHPVSVTLYSHRRSILLPERITRQGLRTCRYLFVMNLVGKFGPNYPLREIDRNRLRLIDFERDHSGKAQAFLFELKHPKE